MTKLNKDVLDRIFAPAEDTEPGTDKLIGRRLLREALESRASDIHIDPLMKGFTIRMRIDGSFWEVGRVGTAPGSRLMNQLKVEVGIDPGTIYSPRVSRHTYKIADNELDIRVTLVPCISGEKMAIRLLDPDRVEHRIEDLGLGEDGLAHFRDWLRKLNGMFLVSGPTGSGKTTTLYALLHELAEQGRHVLTIEDPVEYEIDGINQIQVDPKHGLDFARGLKSMLRLDPDYMMVGELREAETAAVAASAATSGHVLLSTIHSRDAVSAITALRNFGMSGNQIAVTVEVIVNQRLVRMLCPHCRRKEEVGEADKTWLEEHGVASPGELWAATGCEKCNQLGFHGRTGIFEIWRLDSADYEMLLAGADERNIRRKLAQEHHATIVNDAMEKAREGVTTIGEIRQAAGALQPDDWQFS